MPLSIFALGSKWNGIHCMAYHGLVILRARNLVVIVSLGARSEKCMRSISLEFHKLMGKHTKSLGYTSAWTCPLNFSYVLLPRRFRPLCWLSEYQILEKKSTFIWDVECVNEMDTDMERQKEREAEVEKGKKSANHKRKSLFIVCVLNLSWHSGNHES